MSHLNYLNPSNLLKSAAIITIINGFAQSAIAEELFGNQGISFDIDTAIEFQFQESHGAFQSEFGVVNLDNCQNPTKIETCEKVALFTEIKPSDKYQNVNEASRFINNINNPNAPTTDFIGTCGNTIIDCQQRFVFKKNTRYALYLASTYNGQPRSTLYSLDAINPNKEQFLKFSGQLADLAAGGINLDWDDTGVVTSLEERDFDDFVIRVGGHLVCPFDNTVETSTPPSESNSEHNNDGGEDNNEENDHDDNGRGHNNNGRGHNN